VKKVLLVAPRVFDYSKCPSLAIAYLGAYLKRQGYEVRGVDEQYTGEDPFQAVRDAEYLLVGISCECANETRALEIAKAAKSAGQTTVLGGLHPSLVREKTLDDACVDYGILGEGDIALYKLCLALEGKLAFEEVPGLMYRDDGRVVCNEMEFIKDLDSMPFPDFTLSGIEKIDEFVPVLTSRGCQYRCAYCSTGSIWEGHWHVRSPENVVEEIEQAKKKYGTNRFHFCDENLTGNTDRAVQLCELLIERNLNIKWWADEGVRADRGDLEFFRLLKRSGCQLLTVAVESLSDEVLARMRKGESSLDVTRAVKLAKEAGLRVGAYLMIGLPGSDYKTDLRTVRFACRHADWPVPWLTIPHHGTKLLEWVKRESKLLVEPKDQAVVNCVDQRAFFGTEAYPARQVQKAWTIARLTSGYPCHLMPLGARLPVQIWRALVNSLRYAPLHTPILMFRVFRQIFRSALDRLRRKG